MFFFNEGEVFDDSGFITSLIKDCNMLQNIFCLAIKLFFEWSNKSFTFSGAISGTKSITKGTSIEGQHGSRGSSKDGESGRKECEFGL
jgi:hypothetical protein